MNNPEEKIKIAVLQPDDIGLLLYSYLEMTGVKQESVSEINKIEMVSNQDGTLKHFSFQYVLK